MSGSERKKLWRMVQMLLVAATFCVEGKPQVPCFFIFGDSLSDSGNNNDLPTLAKANYNPYGLHFPLGPTGRSTNGRTVPDFLGEMLGIEKFIPPFANTSGSDILRGVNYASSAAGIRLETGTDLGVDVSMVAQIGNHGTIVNAITAELGSVAANNHLRKCLYHVTVGSNDYINNYFKPQFYPSSRIYDMNQYADTLIHQYSLQLRVLQDLGARKFALVGLGLVGCTPSEREAHGSKGCVEAENRAVSMFNEKLKSMVDDLNSDDSSFVFVNSTAIFSRNPLFLSGFKVENDSCCRTVARTGLCVENSRPCQNSDEYIFWDGYHPTERVNRILAASSYNSTDPTFTYPMDIHHLLPSPSPSPSP